MAKSRCGPSPDSVLAAANPRFGSYDDMAGTADQAFRVARLEECLMCCASNLSDGLRNHHLDPI